MSSIFLNYRKGPHTILVSALAERLALHFGSGTVFVDAQLRPGGRYPDELRQHLQSCAVLVAVIHTGWVRNLADRGRHKNSDEHRDWVELEIATALAAGKTVIPLLLDETAAPTHDQLPPSIADIAHRQAAHLRAGSFTADLDELVRQLEYHVAPAGPTAEAAARLDATDAAAASSTSNGTPRTRIPSWLWFAAKVLSWSTAFTVAMLPLAAGFDGPSWLGLLSVVTVSAIFMTPALLLAAALVPRRAVYRLERRAGAMSYPSYLGKTWGVAVLLIAAGAIPWVKVVDLTGDQLSWGVEPRVFLALVGFILMGYWLQRIFQQTAGRDRQWPPVVSIRPAVFRRAAHRLYERLTTAPDWRHPRSRQHQEQAAKVYRALDEARQELLARRKWSWRRCLLVGESETVLPAAFLGWALTSTSFLVIAGFVRHSAGAMPLRSSLVILGTALIVGTLAATAVALDLWAYRRHRLWLAEEISTLLSRLHPLVFASRNSSDKIP